MRFTRRGIRYLLLRYSYRCASHEGKWRNAPLMVDRGQLDDSAALPHEEKALLLIAE